MYQHILVPVDDSALSITTVGQAVALARRLDARITFFHARRSRQPEVQADRARAGTLRAGQGGLKRACNRRIKRSNLTAATRPSSH